MQERGAGISHSHNIFTVKIEKKVKTKLRLIDVVAIRTVWKKLASAVPREVKIRLHLLWPLISAGKVTSNLTRLHNAIPTTTRKRGE